MGIFTECIRQRDLSREENLKLIVLGGRLSTQVTAGNITVGRVRSHQLGRLRHIRSSSGPFVPFPAQDRNGQT